MDYLCNGNKDTVISAQTGMDGARLLETIYKVCDKGADAEVRKNKDGTYKVYEVKKKIAV